MAIVDASPSSNTDFYEPPLEERLVNSTNLKITDIYYGWLSNFYQTIVGFLTINGILLPQLTTAQRDALLNPIGGQMIYNLDTDLPQVFVYTSHAPFQGNWKTFVLT